MNSHHCPTTRTDRYREPVTTATPANGAPVPAANAAVNSANSATEHVVRSFVRPLAFVAAFGFAAGAVGFAIVLGPANFLTTADGIATVIGMLICLAVGLLSPMFPLAWAYATTTFLVSVIAIIEAVVIATTSKPALAGPVSYIELAIIAAGAIHLHRSWWLASVLICWVAWLVGVLVAGGIAEMWLTIIPLLVATVISAYLNHYLRNRFTTVANKLAEAQSKIVRDDLTSVFSRSGLIERVIPDAQRAVGEGCPVTATYVDIVNLREINEQYGRDAGDSAIRETAAALLSQTDPADVVSRIGGDEFVIISLQIPLAPQELAAKVNQYLATVNPPGREWMPQITAGQAGVEKPSDSIPGLIDRAERDLYMRTYGRL